jgi:uncharacterized protein (DUF488 family)
MQWFDLFSIGHSNIAAERFLGLLRAAGADAVADVRSTPFSRRFPWFSGKNLAPLLAREGMLYAPFGDALGGRPRDTDLYCDGVADYEAMAKRTEFRSGLERLVSLARERRVCLMCAEREPLDCHRCLLVARALADRGLAVGHILHDGAIEPHAATEARLLAMSGTEADLFVTGHLVTRHGDRLAAAYRRRAGAVAYRQTGRQSGAAARRGRIQ